MNEEGQNFDPLRRLLALKRHEAPPPRYFNELPGKIVAQLGEMEPVATPTLWQRLVQLLAERPAFATGAGVAAGCLLLGLVAFNPFLASNDGPTTAQVPGSGARSFAIAEELAGTPVATSNEPSAQELFKSLQPAAVPVSTQR